MKRYKAVLRQGLWTLSVAGYDTPEKARDAILERIRGMPEAHWDEEKITIIEETESKVAQ